MSMLTILSWVLCTSAAAAENPTIKLTQYKVNASVHVRFVHATVAIELQDTSLVGGVFPFQISMPQSAFVSRFRMRTLSGDWQTAVVKGKEEAQAIYDQARASGQSAAQVVDEQPLERDMEIFSVPVFVRPGTTVHAQLEYQQLLERRSGTFRFRLPVVPPAPFSEEVVAHVDVYEPRGFSSMSAYTPCGSRLKVLENDDGFIWQQRKLDECDVWVEHKSPETVALLFRVHGCNAHSVAEEHHAGTELRINYDTAHAFDVGDVLVQGYHFVHFFSPEIDFSGYLALPKAVVFVVDISGSMRGLKEQQAREAMIEIVGQLDPRDMFNIVLFDNTLLTWSKNLAVASLSNIRSAQEFVKRMLRARGTTDIDSALNTALGMLKVVPSTLVPMAVLLSDGQPTAGITMPRLIRANAEDFHKNGISLHALGFGFDLDFQLMQALAWENQGEVRRIYAERDAAVQLRGFFDEIAKPVLKDLNWDYGEVVESESLAFAQANTHVYFDGGELAVAGCLAAGTSKDDADTAEQLWLNLQVTGHAMNSSTQVAGSWPFSWLHFLMSSRTRTALVDVVLRTSPLLKERAIFEEHGLDKVPATNLPPYFAATSSQAAADLPDGFTARLWAHLRIKELLRRAAMSPGKAMSLAADEANREAMQLAIKYALVTPITSLVVVEAPAASSSSPIASNSNTNAASSSTRNPANGNRNAAISVKKNNANAATSFVKSAAAPQQYDTLVSSNLPLGQGFFGLMGLASGTCHLHWTLALVSSFLITFLINWDAACIAR